MTLLTDIQGIIEIYIGPFRLVTAVWFAFAIIAVYAGARKDRPLAGIFLGVLLGPAGARISVFLPYGGNRKCPSCGKRTWWAPKLPDTGPPYTSEPHLRCNRCGEIIWNEAGAMPGPGVLTSLSDRVMDVAQDIYVKISRK